MTSTFSPRIDSFNELRSIADEGRDTSVCCHFCGKEYVFSPDEIRKLIGE